MYEQTNTMMETKTSFQIPQLLDGDDFTSEDLADDMEGLRLSFTRIKIPGGGHLQFEIPSGNPDVPDYAPYLDHGYALWSAYSYPKEIWQWFWRNAIQYHCYDMEEFDGTNEQVFFYIDEKNVRAADQSCGVTVRIEPYSFASCSSLIMVSIAIVSFISPLQK